MSTTPLVSESHTDLNTPQTSYAAVIDGANGPEIAPAYHNLSHVQQRYILALYRAGEPTLAQRVAGCYRSGTIFQLCPKGAYARGYKHRCGDPLCSTCSRPRFRFYAWAAKRDHSIFHRPCVGLEFFVNPSVLRDGAIWAVREFLKDNVCLDAIMLDAFDSSTLSVRCIVPLESVDRKDLQWHWKQQGKLSIKTGDPVDLYLWAFSGMIGAACLAPEQKAALRISIKKERLVRTIGSFYAPLPKVELIRRRAATESHNPATCPVCKDHPLETLTLENRRADSVESIEATFDSVEWAAEHESPFLVRRGNLTNKFDGDYSDSPVAPTATPSPPH